MDKRLLELKRRVDEALKSETTESLHQWVNEFRRRKALAQFGEGMYCQNEIIEITCASHLGYEIVSEVPECDSFVEIANAA